MAITDCVSCEHYEICDPKVKMTFLKTLNLVQTLRIAGVTRNAILSWKGQEIRTLMSVLISVSRNNNDKLEKSNDKMSSHEIPTDKCNSEIAEKTAHSGVQIPTSE